jgi:cytochrome P450
MALHPEAQIKAQEELKRVVGTSRLPDFLDKENLPYLNALIKETMRLFPTIPLGAPHRLTVEDEYQGMRIPKGSIIFPNVR